MQALVGSILISAGIVLAGLVVREAVLVERMQREVDDFWSARRSDPAHPLPRAASMAGHLERPGEPMADLPPQVRELPAGLHALPARDAMVFIDDDPRGRVYLTFAPTLVDRAILYTGLASLAVSLLVTWLLTWRTYRTSRRLVGPVSWLANVVRLWDPRNPDTSAITPANLPEDAGGEVRRLARSLSDLSDRVAQLVGRERDFTRDASHELRTPLTVIRVATDLMMADPDTTARAQRSLARVQRAGRDMESVIDAFLILAREAGGAVEVEALQVRAIVDEELERVRPLLTGKPVELAVVDDGAPQLVAPRHVLNVMLGNLLSNAARFTERGRIEVRLAPAKIEVRDTGIGMSAEALSKVFNPFYRVDTHRDDAKGMGLSIVRRLGDRFGWPVDLESAPGEGTVATIRFGGAPEAPRPARTALS